jgi:hypothetical protein
MIKIDFHCCGFLMEIYENCAIGFAVAVDMEIDDKLIENYGIDGMQGYKDIQFQRCKKQNAKTLLLQQKLIK